MDKAAFLGALEWLEDAAAHYRVLGDGGRTWESREAHMANEERVLLFAGHACFALPRGDDSPLDILIYRDGSSPAEAQFAASLAVHTIEPLLHQHQHQHSHQHQQSKLLLALDGHPYLIDQGLIESVESVHDAAQPFLAIVFRHVALRLFSPEVEGEAELNAAAIAVGEVVARTDAATKASATAAVHAQQAAAPARATTGAVGASGAAGAGGGGFALRGVSGAARAQGAHLRSSVSSTPSTTAQSLPPAAKRGSFDTAGSDGAAETLEVPDAVVALSQIHACVLQLHSAAARLALPGAIAQCDAYAEALRAAQECSRIDAATTRHRDKPPRTRAPERETGRSEREDFITRLVSTKPGLSAETAETEMQRLMSKVHENIAARLLGAV